MTIGALFYMLYLAIYILPLERSEHKDNETLQNLYWFIYVSILVVSIVTGFGGGLIWVGQGKYVSECANEKNKGLFNGIFWAIYMSS